MADMGGIIDEIRATPHFRLLKCSACGGECRVHALAIYGRCPACGEQIKCRSFSAVGTEVADVIDAVLEWAGEGESFDAVMERYRQIIVDQD